MGVHTRSFPKTNGNSKVTRTRRDYEYNTKGRDMKELERIHEWTWHHSLYGNY